MSNRIHVTVSYLVAEHATPRSAYTTHLVSATLAALHERTAVEKHTLYADKGVVEIGLWVLVAGAGETHDIVDRLKNEPGLPPRDVRYRIL